MKHPKFAGIYAIRHIDSDWSYIGSATSIYNRWRGHRSDLRRNRHHCPHLQNAWNKHGESAFAFQVLEICLKEQVILYHREQVWMDLTSSRLYNTSHQSEPRIGQTMSPEHRTILSNRMKGNQNGANRSYCGFLTENDVRRIIHRYSSGESTKYIAISFNISQTNIYRIIKRTIWKEVEIARLGTKQRGENNSRAKLTYAIAEEIRSLARDGMKIPELARRYGIGHSHARAIISGKIWKNPPLTVPELTPLVIEKNIELPPINLDYHHRKKRENPPQKISKITVNCHACDKKLLRLPRIIRRHKHHYCNKECRDLMTSERMRIVMENPVRRANLVAINTGKKASMETRAKMSKSNKIAQRNRSKLSLDDVITIRKKLENNHRPSVIARQYDVSIQTICSIRDGKTWQ
jgi:group I intron endonuclease